VYKRQAEAMGNRTNKLMEASMALLQAAPDGQLNIVVLNKGLFYLDLIALRDVGRTVTGERYVALPQGPVVEGYGTKIVKALEAAGLAEQLVDGRARPVRITKRLPSFKCLTDTEVQLAGEVAKAVSPFTSRLLSDYSHHNSGWLLARRGAIEGLPAPEINMRVALQQIAWADDDDWMEAEPDEALAAEIENAQHAVTVWE
jgi:hypothetical protein